MTTGWGTAGAAAALDAAGAAFTWIKLHTGDPGSAGSANAATNTTRRQATWAATAAGVLSNSGDIVWSSGMVTANETYTHYSAWSASSAGSFGFSGVITGGAVTAGTSFTIPTGDLDNAATLAS
jgi:hypothetical protein